jgi:hypothetical protein
MGQLKGVGNMQTVVLIIALWLILVGIYGAVSLLRGQPRPARKETHRHIPRRAANEQPRGAGAVIREVPSEAPNAILSEVDLLRAQVRHLRSEVFAMSGKDPEPVDKNKSRRYRAGAYNDLPRPLRRHLRETRGVRTA